MSESVNLRDYPNFAEAELYARKVVAGDIDACVYVRKACERYFHDIESAPDRGLYFDLEHVEKRCQFIQRMPHTKGKWAARGEVLKLQPWQLFVTVNVFGWKRVIDDTRRFREVYLECPRKNGKSPWSAAIGLSMMVMDDEFGAEVYCGASTEEQAWHIFRPAKIMVQKLPDLRSASGLQVYAKNISIDADNSKFEPVIGSPPDGAAPSCALVDEYHEMASDALLETMLTGMVGREQPLLIITTTAGFNLAGPCYMKSKHAKAVLMGSIDDDQLFTIVYTIDDPDHWDRDESLKIANPNYGISVNKRIIEEDHEKAIQQASKQNAFKTKHLDLWVGGRTAWVNMAAWSKCPLENPPISEMDGRDCYCGVDLSSKIDLAAYVRLFPPVPSDDYFRVYCSFFLPSAVLDSSRSTNVDAYKTWSTQNHITLTPGNIIDYDFIMDEIREDCARFNVCSVGYDPWNATHLATVLMGETVPMVEISASVKNYSPAMKTIEAWILAGDVAHGDNPVLTWCASNVVAREDNKSNVFPVKDNPDSKIDGIVALIHATARYEVMLDEEDEPPPKTVYRKRGVASA